VISPDKIPTFTGDLVELQREIGFMRQAAKAIREHGADVNARFQHLDASYRAPEAGQLFATTQAVEGTASSFADDLETAAGALSDYVVEVAEIVKQLESLRGQAAVFVESVQGDQGAFRDWTGDQDKVDEHQAIWDGVNAAVAAFQRAEVACADRITATVEGTRWHINDGSPKQKNAYGFSADQLGEADVLPWGSPAHHTTLPFGVDHHLREFGVSVFDNAAGAAEGLVNLFSPGEEGDATRDGLARVFIGIGGYALDPLNDRDDLDPGFDRLLDENRPYAMEFAKSFVGWDDWATNPAKAAGTVVFNGLTLGAGPLGVASRAGGAAGKTGAGARIAGGLARIGEVLDPIGAATRTVGAAARVLPKISELTSGIRAAADVAGASDAAHSVIRLSDGSHLRVSDGEFIPGHRGVTDTTPAPHEPSAAARAPKVEPARPQELVGAGARTGEARAHGGDDAPSRAADESSAGGGRGEGGGGGRDVPTGGAAASRGTNDVTSLNAGEVGAGAESPRDGGRHGTDASRAERSTGHPHAEANGERGAGGSDASHDPASDADGSREPEQGEVSDSDAGDASPNAPQRGDNGAQPDGARPALPPGQAELSLRELRALRAGRQRFTAAEEMAREMFSGGAERHYRVPTHEHPYYPVESPGGRKVDVPVDLPGGRTLAVEIKHYLEFRTIRLADGTNEVVRGEVPLNKGIMEQINKDLTLRRMDPGYDPRWVFMHAPPSPALRSYLVQARIIFIEYGPAPKK
jgi:hypothetical protein